jgi:hypothetical protein
MANLQAKKCVPVRSSWVRYFIEMCDLNLAVQFYDSHHPHHPKKPHPRPDVCCYYPNTVGLFDLAVSAPSPGRFVHHYLYKKRPYLIIQPPCPAQTCPPCKCNPPNTVHFSVTNLSGCACLAGTYALVYGADPAHPTDWYWGGTVCGRANVEWRLKCDLTGPFWAYNLHCQQIKVSIAPDFFSCAPWTAIWRNEAISSLCCNGNIAITVTP